ncbi:MAG: sigma-54-dependent Fis family transcriptional regulator [Verrucomicrobia bacterium]|nr:sigma-54-dependent Fis family transcriptional regulator [Verrucomicrobiota bacterium]
MARTRILVVDDEPGMLEVCADTLKKLAHAEILLESQSARAAERIAEESPDLLIADICMPGLSGVELLRQARQHDPNVAVLMLTAYPTVETAVESMKLGAADYIAKPFLPEDLLAVVRRLLESKQLREENRLLRRQVERAYAFGEILGKSQVMQKVFESIRRVAETDFDVLIIGETGTGKELVARAIHQRSRRQGASFVPVDCGAIPDELMESEFFGHERGAFTGAQTRSMGLLEFANKGTFFLDEINQLPLRLQSKLLRVLQERKVRRVGGTKEIDLDVRIVAASSQSLAEAVHKQQFRLDLFHRIHVARIDLPSLRDRAEDIPLLVDHFLNRYSSEMEKPPLKLSPEVMEVLANYPWPGNVRELQNVLKRTLALSRRDVIALEDLPDEIVARAGDLPTPKSQGFFYLREGRLAAFEKEYFRNLLTAWNGDVSAAAREAQLPRGTLYRLLKKHELNPADFRGGSSESEAGSDI